MIPDILIPDIDNPQFIESCNMLPELWELVVIDQYHIQIGLG
jgi:hypothetical protein